VRAMTSTRTSRATRALIILAASISTLLIVAIGPAPASVLPQETELDSRMPTSRVSETSARAGRPTPVPILMYHVIADPRADAPFPQLFVRPTDFAGQMRWLARHGYHPVTLRAVWNHWRHGAPLPSKPIVVSFDDGYRSVAHAALPPMRERHWPGVLNLTVKNLRVAGGLSERQVRRLIAAGWEIDAHTVTHPDLTGIGHRQLAREVAGSRREIRRLFGVPVDFFCYPAGRYDGRVIAAVRRAGFLGATTTLEGLADPSRPYELRRVRVSRSDGVAGLAAKLLQFRGSGGADD
jgi:peptidoglycan/xylan/chitin deacetylase (PgdA/CDA1 family)